MEKPRVLVLFKMKRRALMKLKKYTDVDVLLYPSKDDLKRVIEKYDALVVSPLNGITGDVIEAGKRLRVISCHSAGYDNIDVETATLRGVYVTKVSGWLSEAVAEFAVGLTIALMRKIAYTDRFVREGRWKSHKEVWSRFKSIETLYGKKVGILGMGAIGRAIARRMRAMGTEVYYWSRSPKPDVEDELGIKYAELDEVLETSDVVVLALPATKETFHLIDEERVKLLTGKYLINVGRGSLVDEKALCKAIEDGSLKGYATDVFEHEPVTEHPLFKHGWETVLTPHHAGLSVESMEDMGIQAVENLLKVFRGEYTDNIVNKAVLNVRSLEEVRML